MNFTSSVFFKILKKLNIKKNDNILVNSNILNLIVENKKNKKKINLIELLKKKVTNKGTLIFPTYSWDFCKFKKFDYKKTLSICGSLSNLSLKDSDFIRTRNPIFSFSVYGKNKKKFFEIPHNDCFSLNSPFGYLINNQGKNLFIDIDYKDAFTFVHLAEQAEKVNYRYKKNFSGIFIDQFNK